MALWKVNIMHELHKLIDCTQSLYSDVSAEWRRRSGCMENLKKMLISDLTSDSITYQHVLDYIYLLNEYNPFIALKLPFACAYQVTFRVKTQNSIEYKIQQYNTGQHGRGKVPIIKCLNDLLGVRIILESPATYDEIDRFMTDCYGKRYRCINSSKQEYKAAHIYFKENNFTFPWELQVWNRSDADKNFASHKKYKQGYTMWENRSRQEV